MKMNAKMKKFMAEEAKEPAHKSSLGAMKKYADGGMVKAGGSFSQKSSPRDYGRKK